MTELETITFHGDDLLVTEIDGKPHVVLKPAFEAIGLDANRQIANLRAQAWATTAVTAVVAADGRTREMVTSDLRSFLMQLATIPASRVAEHVRPKLIEYQREVADVIEAHFTKRGFWVQPTTVTWIELAALIRQHWGPDLATADIRRGLRDGGVLRQDGAPRANFRNMFWFTGSAWNIHLHAVPEIVHKLFATRRALGDIQSQLQLDLALDKQLRRELGRS
mgnify:CR=1 FL=1